MLFKLFLLYEVVSKYLKTMNWLKYNDRDAYGVISVGLNLYFNGTKNVTKSILYWRAQEKSKSLAKTIAKTRLGRCFFLQKSEICNCMTGKWFQNSFKHILQHEAPVKTVHWIKAPNYSCVMTGSWDKTLKVSL